MIRANKVKQRVAFDLVAGVVTKVENMLALEAQIQCFIAPANMAAKLGNTGGTDSILDPIAVLIDFSAYPLAQNTDIEATIEFHARLAFDAINPTFVVLEFDGKGRAIEHNGTVGSGVETRGFQVIGAVIKTIADLE